MFKKFRKAATPSMLVAIAAVVLAASGSAVASHFITGKQIKNGTITRADIRKGTITLDRLSPGTRALVLKAAHNGKDGQNGKDGAAGAKGDQGAPGKDAVTSVASFGGDFAATNSTVTMGSGGAHFGPYADGGAAGGSVCYSGLNGEPLGAITSLIYKAKYSTDDDNTVGAPYLRVFLNDDNDDVIYSPNTQPHLAVSEDVFHSWEVTAGTVRYDDDAGSGSDSPWADIVGAHGDEIISSICVTSGFSAGDNLETVLRSLDVNGDRFVLGS